MARVVRSSRAWWLPSRSNKARSSLTEMIDRYTRPEMGRIWTEENKYRAWLDVELASAEALAETGEVPKEAAAILRKHSGFEVSRIQDVEREAKHDFIAFTTLFAETMPPPRHPEPSRCFHYGLPSNY